MNLSLTFSNLQIYMYTQQKVQLPDGHELNHLVEEVQRVNVSSTDKSTLKSIMTTELMRFIIHYNHCLSTIDEILMSQR